MFKGEVKYFENYFHIFRSQYVKNWSALNKEKRTKGGRQLWHEE